MTTGKNQGFSGMLDRLEYSLSHPVSVALGIYQLLYRELYQATVEHSDDRVLVTSIVLQAV